MEARYAVLTMSQQTLLRLQNRNAAAFAEEERQGIMLAAKVRLFALILILAWVAYDSPDTGLEYFVYLLEIFAFVVLGGLQYWCARTRFYTLPLTYLFVAIDCLFMAIVFSVPLPFDDAPLPPAIAMDTARFLYFFMFLMQATFSFRPALVLWCGVCIIAARAGMWVWHLSIPGTYSNLDLEERSAEAWIEAASDLNFLFLGYAATEILVVLIISAGLAVVVSRSKTLVRNRLTSERRRASLARYFSPKVADRISESDTEFAAAKQQEVAILFADVMGFTKLCEQANADEVVDLLREYHDRLGNAVFSNNGTLDKYIGDGLMATFGTPDPSPRDAHNALSCALDMIDELEQWNEERATTGAAPVRVGIGLHWGSVVAGDIGNERRLEYAVIGDTVNIASRLEQLTRRLNTTLIVSDDLMQRIDQKALSKREPQPHFENLGDQNIRGRVSGVSVWALSVR